MINYILSCDWGTTSFRLRLIDRISEAILAEVTEGKGMAVVHDEWIKTTLPENERVSFYKRYLQSKIEQISEIKISSEVPVIISGMASSSIGITEMPYRYIPFHFHTDKLLLQKMPADKDCAQPLIIVSGLCTDKEVMRGEETMLLGADFSNKDNWLVILPGTHSKHVTIRNKAIINIATYVTGEVFDLLAYKSVIAKSVTKSEAVEAKFFFEKGVLAALNGNILNTVFQVRTNQLFNKLSAAENFHYLSGLVIGAELKELTSCKMPVCLISNSLLMERYKEALPLVGISNEVRCMDADNTFIKGHCKLASQLL
jgi:2-dehydro-3-deoxygalactonokinase